MTLLTNNDVTWITKYSMDSIGKVFKWNGRLFRKIYSKKKDYVLKLIQSEMFRKIVSKHLFVNTWLSDTVSFGDGDIVVEHEYIDYKVAPNNSIAHVHRIADMLLVLNKELVNYGYILSDPHFSNVVFDGSVPVYVDLGSIVPITDDGFKSWCYFLDQYYYPFYLINVHKKHSFSICCDIVLRPGFYTNNFADFLYLAHGRLLGCVLVKCVNLKRKIDSFIFNGIYIKSKSCIKNLVKQVLKFFFKSKALFLKKKILGIQKKLNSFKFYGSTQWGDYQSEYNDELSPRFLKIAEIIKSLNVSSCLELAANQGLFCKYLIENDIVNNAICSDYDIVALEKGFSSVSENDRINKKITFSCINIMAMVSGNVKMKCELIKSDLVVALAVTHHLILTQKIDIDALMEFFSCCTNRYIIVEFMPLGLWNGVSAPELPEWYTLDWFLDNLKKRFKINKVEQLEPNRIMILGELYN